MIIDVVNKILFLNNGAKFSIWNNDPQSYGGGENPKLLDGYLVDWNNANILPPPSQVDLDNIDPVQLSNFIESNRKTIRNAGAVNNLALIGCYQMEKLNNQSLTFSDYLDSLEALQKSM